ncbi:alpha/beta hydrolase [Eubacterium sp.]
MANSVKEKKKKHTGAKTMGIVFGIILAIIIAATAVIFILTKPVDDKSDKAVYVGGLLSSQSIEYKDASSKGLESNPIIKIMQIVWKGVDKDDKKNHAEQTPPSKITKVKDIEYLGTGNPYHMLDVFYPEGDLPEEGLPVIIDIHGGGWMYATKDLNEYYCMELASKGYTVFSISYRLVPDVTVNEQIQDCASALKWISENMKNYPANASSVMLTGDSAGGQLALYEAVLNQSPELREIFNTQATSLNIKALLLTSPVAYMKNGGMYSVYTKPLWGKDYKQKATYNYMDLSEIIEYADNMPPTFFITSSGDTLAHDQTVTAYNLFQERGIESELIDYGEYNGEKQEHVFSVLDPFSEPSQEVITKALDFYQKALLK